MSARKRSGSGSKRPKEKVVYIYELLLRAEQPHQPSATQPNTGEFWNEFFLLHPNVDSLDSEFAKLSADQLLAARDNLQLLFAQCIGMLELEEHPKRITHALQTLCALFHALFRRQAAAQEAATAALGGASAGDPAAGGSGGGGGGTCAAEPAAVAATTASVDAADIIATVFAGANLPDAMRRLIGACNALLLGARCPAHRFMCLKLLLVLSCGCNSVSHNPLLPYVCSAAAPPLFDAFVRLLSDSQLRAQHGHDVVILLTLLVNYRRHETPANPYVVQLSLLADELALNGYGQMISAALVEFGRQYAATVADQQPAASSWFSSLSSMVGNMFVSDEGGADRVQQLRANNALLLALYEAVHLNRNFITTLAHTQAEVAGAAGGGSAPPSPASTLSAAQAQAAMAVQLAATDAQAQQLLAQQQQQHQQLVVLDVSQQYPSNLLVAMLQYCSIVQQDTKSEASAANLKLGFLVLQCIAEDQYACSMMHDSNLTFRVQLQRAPMRHRKAVAAGLGRSQPLAATLLDLLVEFTRSHLMKKFPMELYLLCTGCVHRVLCYQKRCRVRLVYAWKELWSGQIALLRFLVQQEQQLVKRCNIFYLALQVVQIFNLFITYGDTFLATTNSYDELYYELNREEKVFTELHALVLRYSQQPDCEYRDDVNRLHVALVNILAIVKHFQNKIKEWLASQGLSTPSEEQVLEVVRKNYDLTLKLQDSLDHYERYSERPKHSAFFANLVREVVIDTRKSIYYSIRDAHSQPDDYLVADTAVVGAVGGEEVVAVASAQVSVAQAAQTVAASVESSRLGTSMAATSAQ